jgi:predicted N-formylglutamate amidohydrolase
VGLSEDSVQARLDRFSRPYHSAIDRLIEEFMAHGIVPALYSIHTFTPVMKGVPRSCHVGVLWDTDQRFTTPLLELLTGLDGVVVAGNEPYDGALAGSTLDRHATGRGLPAAMIEVRQDLVATEEAAASWGAILAQVAEPILKQPTLHELQPGPSRCRLSQTG